MGIDCPRCHSANIARTRRRGIFDHIRAQFGLWPYICRICGKRFRASQRYPPSYPRQRSPVNNCPAQNTSFAGPQMAYRADAVQPIAKIVLQADNHAQMHDVLLAIGRAVAALRAVRDGVFGYASKVVAARVADGKIQA